MLTRLSWVRTKRKTSPVSREGLLTVSTAENTRDATRGQGHPRRAPKPTPVLLRDVASTASLTVWLLLGIAAHVGWVP